MKCAADGTVEHRPDGDAAIRSTIGKVRVIRLEGEKGSAQPWRRLAVRRLSDAGEEAHPSSASTIPIVLMLHRVGQKRSIS
jgi:hypothetical protein